MTTVSKRKVASIGGKERITATVSKRKKCASLHEAVKSGKLATVETILRNGGDVNLQDCEGNSPLHIAVYRNDQLVKELVTILLEKGAYIRLQNKHGDTALIVAIKYNPECVPLIIKGVSGKEAVNIPNNWGYYPLHYAVENENTQFLKARMHKGPSIECQNRWGIYPPHYTVENFNHPLLKALKVKGATKGSKNSFEIPPLALGNSTSSNCVQLLLESGALVNISERRGLTPLHWAILHYTGIDVVQLLLQKGAEVNSQAKDGRTPLHLLYSCSMYSDKILIANTLLDWGASLTIKDKSGQTPLDISPEVDKCVKQHIVRRACVKLSDPLNDESTFKDYKASCLQEIEGLKLVRFGKNSLLDIFYHYSDPVFFANEPLKNAVHQGIYKECFPIYCSLLQSTYKSAEYRADLIKAAADTLITPLPREITWYILTFVDNNSLRKVVQAKDL